jgi:glyoxylase-like metal-dependent hydrolase (beta-lactamase superfamily II)
VFVDETDTAGRGAAMLFAGDHVLPHITPSIGFEPAAQPGALVRYLSSLAAVRAEPDRVLLPAHGPVAPSVHARVDELLVHHDRRLDEIAAAVDAGMSTAAEIAGALRWTRRELRLDDLETFNRMLAVLETDAHLEMLAAQGRVRRAEPATVPGPDGDGVVRHTSA